MDSSTSDFSITSDSDLNLTNSSYNLHSNKVSPIAIFLILILLVMLIGFFLNNLSISTFEPNLEKMETRPEVKPEIKKLIHKHVHSGDIKQALNLTNHELNKSINQLTNLVNRTDSENQEYNEEIKTLEKTIEDLKSEVIILQSKLLHQELNKSEEKPVAKPVETRKVEARIPNINVTTGSDVPNMVHTYNNFQDDVIIYDPIANYDRLKLNDPLVDPRGRSSADQIPTPQVAAQLNFPTQGVIDRYHRVGLLIATDNDSGNKKKLNVLESNSGYSMNTPTSSSPTYYADLGSRVYNGVDVVSGSKSNSKSTNNVSSIFTSSSPATITSLSPKSKDEKHKKKKHRKNKHRKEHFGIEGFSTEDNYETFESSDDIDYNGEVPDDSDELNDPNNKLRKFPYFDKYEYELNSGDNFTNLENSSYEGFGNLGNSSASVNISSGDNNILELIGKKITDNWYKYFTSISVGNKVIKINVHNRNRRELYDGDIVFIQELGKRYRVKIDEMDMIEYNPYFY